ncbi:MAG: hypothetical protein HYY44_04025 [Deltaproteobacteria bacterium]|nr:hypothetical protein [Deltaproteobacteria bacterium]
MFKPEHRFWAVVETDAGNGEYPIEIIRPEEDALDLPHPKIDSCKVTPVRTAPFVRVDVNITGAATARVEAEFPGIQRLGGTGWLGGSGRSWRSLVIQRNLTLTSHDFHGMVYIPVKDHLLNVRCFASGVTVGGSGGGGIMRANKVVIGSETSERVDLDESDAYLNSLDLSEEDAPKFFKATPDEGQETGIPINEDCAEANDDILLRNFIRGTWSDTSHSYTNGHLSADDRIGQCNPKISWDFSQPMTVTEIAPPYPYNTTTVKGNGLEDGSYRVPFAGEIKVAAYPDWDSLNREWFEINEGYSYSDGTPTDSEATCLYKFVANDFTQGGIQLDAPDPETDYYLGQGGCRDSSLSLEIVNFAGEDEDSEWYLRGSIEKSRDYRTKNIYRIWVRQQTNAIGTAAIPRRETLDLRYVSEFEVAPSSIIENQEFVSDFGKEDGAINRPIDENWVIKIPFKFQHVDLGTLQTQLLCWGEHPDTDLDGLDNYTDDDADGDGQEDARYPWWGDRYDRDITRRAGWLDRIPQGQTKAYFAHVGAAYVRGDCPSGSFGVGNIGRCILEAWGPFHFSTNQFPTVSPENENIEMAVDGPQEIGEDQVQKRRGNIVQPASAVQGPYFQFTTKFRECLFRVKATGVDGRPFEKEIAIPSSENWDELTAIPDVGEDEGFDYYTEVQYDGTPHSLHPYYTTSHNFGFCTAESDCPFNCQELDGARPCNECRQNGNGQYKCYSREFDPHPLDYNLADCLDDACFAPVKGGT